MKFDFCRKCLTMTPTKMNVLYKVTDRTGIELKSSFKDRREAQRWLENNATPGGRVIEDMKRTTEECSVCGSEK